MQLDRYANWILATAAVTLVSFTFLDGGLSWDEPVQSYYGDLILRFYESGLQDREVLEFRDLYRYGGWFDAPVQWLVRYSPLGGFGTRRMATALVGLIGVLFCGLTARRIGGKWAGFSAALLLLSAPPYFGHMFMNPKDLPFAVGAMACLYFIVRVGLRLAEARKREIGALALALGITLGIRIGGVLLCAYLLAAVLMARPAESSWRVYLRRVAPRLVAIYGIAYVVMLAFWPYALLNPLTGPLTALRATGAFPLETKVLLGGELVTSTSLPLTYLPQYFAVKLPLVLLATVACALAYLIRPRLFAADGEDPRPMRMLALAAFFPLTFAMITGSNHYGAIRHFLFVIPPMACMAGVAVASILRDRRRRLHAAALGALLVVGVGASGMAMLRLHPYEYVYYNELVGGVGGAEGRYEMDYWALSLREAAEKLDDWVIAEGIEASPETPIHIYVCGPRDAAMYFLNDSYAIVESVAEADFTISTSRWYCEREAQGATVTTVTRDGAVLSFVNDVRGL